MMARNEALPTLFQRTLLDDFERKLYEIDRAALASQHYPPPVILQLSRHDKSATHKGSITVGDFASYIPVTTFIMRSLEEGTIARTRQCFVDTYVIWIEPNVRWFEMILEGKLLSMGRGHFAINERWLLLSLALVRARILSNRVSTGDAGLRTKESLVKHRDLFSKPGDDLSGLRTLLQEPSVSEEELAHDPVALDIYWTLRLFVGATAHGLPYERALALLYSDEC